MKPNNTVKVCSCTSPYKNLNTKSLASYPINESECVYEFDIELKKITFSKGFQTVFGYYNGEVNYHFLQDKCHPDDAVLVAKILRSVQQFNLDNPGECSNNKLFISLRLRKIDGDYIKVFCKYSVNSLSPNGHIRTVLGVITDISFMEHDNHVKWTFLAKGLKPETFRNKIYKQQLKVFTEREIQVIKEMYKKIATQEIAANLCISRHTVATHRKNILRKSNCHNVQDLIHFCTGIGISFS